MLDILKRGTVAIGSNTWEYHGDTVDPTMFYVTPQPVWLTNNNLPEIQLVQYETSDSSNGSGYCTLQVELGVPTAVMPPITADINSRFGVTPNYLTIPFQPGTIVTLTYPDGQGGTTGLQADGTDFGSNTAIFQVQLDADQMKTMKAALANTGGSPFEIQYNIIVPAQMAAVTAVLSFDSTIAFNYEVTAHEHTHWASSSSWTYDITEQLNQSNASTVTVTKTDPSLPESVVDSIRNWGQSVITDLVTQEVQEALSIQQSAGGTQSFSISQVSSISETYQQNEVILWRLQPQAILPSFGDLGLTTTQISQLEPIVDKRQFVAVVTPQCDFKVNNKRTLNPDIKTGDNPFVATQVLIDHIDVTIDYPTLTSSATRTQTFSNNTPVTWQGDWDDAVGGVYSLTYAAVYTDGTIVNGSVEDLDASAFTLGLPDIGTLNVTFDASRFFTIETSLVSEVTVDFVFNIPQRPPYLESATLNAKNPQFTFASVFAAPITTDFLYTVTYLFDPATKANPYTTDAKQENGQWVRLDEPDLQQSFNVAVQISDPTNPNVTVSEADINFYYDGVPFFPAIPASQALPSPTDSSPIQLNFPIAGSTAAVQMQKITFFANTKLTPLTVTGTVLTSDFNQVEFGPYQFAPQTVALLGISPSKQFVFVEADATIVDWTTGKLSGITVHITEVRYTTSAQSGPQKVTTNTSSPVQTIQWDTAENRAYSAYFIVAGLPNGFSGLEFDWYAEYIYAAGTLYGSGTEQGTSLALPKNATATAPPKASSSTVSGSAASSGG